MTLYFAYGSNMRSARLIERVGAVRSVGAAHVTGWDLRFDKPGRDGTGKANLVAAAGVRAWGVAYEISPEAWPALDRYEPGYRRERFRLADTAGQSFEAVAYLYPAADRDLTARAPEARLSPSDEYLAHLLAGAREHGLPRDWISTIRSAARPAD